MSGRRFLWIFVAAALAAGCGGDDGGDEPTRRDLDTVEAILRSTASVQEAFQPLYSCLPGDTRCYTESGPNAADVVTRERRSIGAILAETDHACLRDAGRLFSRSLDAYTDAAWAASNGEPAAFDTAISRATEIEIAYTRKLGTCGFSQGESAEIGAALREINIELLRLSDRVVKCADQACIVDVARRMEKEAAKGVSLLDEYFESMPEDTPACFPAAFEIIQSAFRSVSETARLLQESKFRKSLREGERSGELYARGARQLANCVASAK